MSRRVVIVIAVVLLFGLAVAGIVGWMWFTRDRVALLTYRIQLVEGVSMREVITREEKLMESEQVLEQVITNLNLVEEWRMDSRKEALAHMREKIIVSEDRIGGRVRVIYRDRKQQRALEILQEIRKVFTPVRVERRDLPPLLPMDAGSSGGVPQWDPLPESP